MEQLNNFIAMAIGRIEASKKTIVQCIRNLYQFLRKFIIRFIGVFWLFFKEFCPNSNIHGVRYFTERVRHWSERLWWISAVGLSLWLSFSMIHTIYVEWQENPMAMSTFEENLPISTVPFPTVIICPDIQIVKKKFDLSSKLDSNFRLLPNVSHKDAIRVSEVAHVCPNLQRELSFNDTYTSESIFNTIVEVAPNVDQSTLSCSWQRKPINCSEHFVPVFTHIGLCFAFNALNSHDMYTNEMAPGTIITKENSNVLHWSLDNGYDESKGSKYPIRAGDAGRSATLEIDLLADKRDFVGICSLLNFGFFVTLATPGELNMIRKAFAVSATKETHIRIIPNMITTSDGLRSYAPSQRKCFYQSERRLRFFKIYTQRNCEAECMANFTKHKCGCVHFSMSRDKETKICGARKIKCYVLIKNTFQSDCDCLPACTSIEYSKGIKVLNMNINAGRNINEIQLNASQQQTKLVIFFGTDQISVIKRLETLTLGDFLAICGGLLGLFLGISALSIIELIYYASLRLFWKLRRPELENNRDSHDHSADSFALNDQLITNHNQTQSLTIRFIRSTRIFLTEFCNNSNIHGVRYFSERRLHWSERWWWIVSFCVTLCLCGLMIRNVWLEWHESPMNMRFNQNGAANMSIPLPTMTICPQIKTMKHKLDITSALNSSFNFTLIEAQRLKSLAHVCPRLPHLVEFKDKFSDESIYDTIQDIAPRIQNTLNACRSHSIPCSKYITSVLTDEGLCFTFNALNSHEIYTDEMAPGMMIVRNNPNVSHWDPENGYNNGSHEGEYPLRLRDFDGKSTIVIALTNSKIDLENQCRGYDQGYKLLLTSPGEVVRMSSDHLALYPSKYNAVAIKPKLTKTSEGLRKYAPNQRQCFYQSERKLRFFKYYMQLNCETECLANFTKAECGCVEFSMPRDKHTKVCGGASIECYKSVNKKFVLNNIDECNCLPACTSIEYKASSSRYQLQLADGYDNRLQPTVLAINLFTSHSHTVERVEKYTFFEFLASCGGLLGVFLGISLLSIIELIYYTTLRLFLTIRRWKLQLNHRIDVIPIEDLNG